MTPSNRGRWGDDDERGTLNLITDAVRARAVAEARTGRTVALARPVTPTPVALGPGALGAGGPTGFTQAMLFTGVTPIALAEQWTVTAHHPQLTHLDALSHVPVDGLVYPGRPLSEVVSAERVTRSSTAMFDGGIVTRGVLLDLAPGGWLEAGHAITGADLDEAATRAGVDVEPGDAVVVRGGWDVFTATDRPIPGVALDALDWLHAHDVALWVGDVGDANPPNDPVWRSPLHQIGIAGLGMPLVDVAAPDELAAVCTELARHRFLLVVAPPRIHGASGVPVNPLAIF